MVFLVCRSGDASGVYATEEWLERVIIVGVGRKPTTVTLKTAKGGGSGLCSGPAQHVMLCALGSRAPACHAVLLVAAPLNLCHIGNSRSYAVQLLIAISQI